MAREMAWPVLNPAAKLRPYSPADFRRQDESDDEGFYSAHIGS